MPDIGKNQRYLAYLSALAIGLSPVVAPSPAEAAPTNDSSAHATEKPTVSLEQLVKMTKPALAPFTECFALWTEC